MQYVSATEAKQRFDALLVTAQREPVTICNQNEDVAVLISPQEYERIRKFHLDRLNRICEQASEQAQANGLTEEKLAEILADED